MLSVDRGDGGMRLSMSSIHRGASIAGLAVRRLHPRVVVGNADPCLRPKPEPVAATVLFLGQITNYRRSGGSLHRSGCGLVVVHRPCYSSLVGVTRRGSPHHADERLLRYRPAAEGTRQAAAHREHEGRAARG